MVEEKQLIQQGVFEFPETKNVLNWYGSWEKPWFSLREVCDILGVKKTSDKSNLLSNSQKIIGSTDTNGGLRDATFISESGLYKIIMSCRTRKDIVVKFQDWVCEDVLPSIRKTGSYHIDNKPSIDLEYKKIQSDETKFYLEFLGKYGDPVDKQFASSFSKNKLISKVHDPNSLEFKYGLHSHLTEMFSIRFKSSQVMKIGKKVADIYRRVYGKEPSNKANFDTNTGSMKYLVKVYSRNELEHPEIFEALQTFVDTFKTAQEQLLEELSVSVLEEKDSAQRKLFECWGKK